MDLGAIPTSFEYSAGTLGSRRLLVGFWVFAAGLTNVEVILTVTDTVSEQVREYENDLGEDYAPVLETQAFLTCDE